jgi:type IV pilus assembly protein PilA
VIVLFIGQWAKPDSKLIEVLFILSRIGYILVPMAGGFFGAVALFEIAFSLNKLKGIFRSIVAVLITLSLFALSIPNFLKFSARAKQSEAKQNLLAIYKAYQTYHSSHGTYPREPSIKIGDETFNCISATGWAPPGPLRYTYECMGTPAYWPGYYAGKTPGSCLPPIATKATKDSFTVAACANIDNDPFIDEWTINDKGELINAMDDVTDKPYNRQESWWSELWNGF